MLKTVTGVPASTSLTPRYSCRDQLDRISGFLRQGCCFLPGSAVLPLVGFLGLVETPRNPLSKSRESLTSGSPVCSTHRSLLVSGSVVVPSFKSDSFRIPLDDLECLLTIRPTLPIRGQTRGVRVAVDSWGWAPLRLGAWRCPSPATIQKDNTTPFQR